MSEKVARLAVNQLRSTVPIGVEPAGIVFPLITDPFSGTPNTQIPNIVVGQYQDFGANAALPIITVWAEGAAEGIVNQYRHLSLHVDIWVGGTQAPNVDGRRLIAIIYEYVFRSLQNVDWSGNKILIKRCYEIERSPIMFEQQNKIYHISNTYRVEALSTTWY